MMDRSAILTTADISTPRQLCDFLSWTKRKNNELSANRETKQYTRSGAVLAKKFRDEIYPSAATDPPTSGKVSSERTSPKAAAHLTSSNA